MGVVIKFMNITLVLFFVDQVQTERQPETVEEFHLLSSPIDERPHDTEADMNMLRVGTNLIWRQVIDLKITLRGCLFPLIVCVSHEAGNSFRGILPYWLSREYQWTLRETGFILLGERLLTALTLSLLPRLSKLVLPGGGVGGSNRIKNGSSDLGLARLCLCLSCIGIASLGFKGTRAFAIISLAVLATGTGFRDAYLSYVTSKLQKHEIARVCIALSMAQYSSIGFGEFVVGEIYSFCLQLEQQPWMSSLPFWLCSLMFAFTVILLCRSD